MSKHIPYLDYMASTPIAPEVLESMMPFLTSIHGNPNSTHAYGKEAIYAIEKAREQVAAAINARAKEIFFTSGATESINLAIKGASKFYRKSGNHIITLKTEHAATLAACQNLESQGFKVTYLDVQQNGLVDIQKLADAITKDTILCSFCYVNNEIGVIQDIEAIAKIVRESGAILHVDAAQAVGKIPLDMQKSNINLLSISGHKCYGPKGIGALYVNSIPKIHLEPILHGGKQELGLRSGTLATHQIVGFGSALELAAKNIDSNKEHISKLAKILISELAEIPNTQINGCMVNRVAHNINITFKGINGKEFFKALEHDIAIASGSACSSHEIAVSHVLLALGLTRQEANATIRISLGNYTTLEEIELMVTKIKDILTRS